MAAKSLAAIIRARDRSVAAQQGEEPRHPTIRRGTKARYDLEEAVRGFTECERRKLARRLRRIWDFWRLWRAGRQLPG